jgi:uncharacterized tellurite resistance protein B-like protein
MQAILSQYSAAEKTAYLGAIAALATADREASAPEQQFLTALAESAELNPAATQQVLATAADTTNESIAQHLDVLKGTELKYSLIADILSFAKADGKYTPDEQTMLEKMATYLGVSTDQVQALGTVVEQAQQQPAADPAAMSQMLTSGGVGDMLKRVGIPSGALLSGLLSVLAPMVLSKVMGGQRTGSAGMGGLGGLLGGGATAPAGGGLGSLGGLLGSVLGGGQSGGQSGGGLGSLMGVLGGLGGRSGYGGIAQGGLGSVLGGLFGR